MNSYKQIFKNRGDSDETINKIVNSYGETINKLLKYNKSSIVLDNDETLEGLFTEKQLFINK